MSFFRQALKGPRPPGPESAEATAALVLAHPSPWSLTIDHAAFAKDQHTPLDWLLYLAEEIPDMVLQNPTFRMHLAMSPDRFRTASMRCQLQLIGCSDTEPELIRLLAGCKSADIDLRIAAAKNPRCPEDLLWAYLGHSKYVRRAMLQNHRVPRALLRQIRREEAYQRGLEDRYRQAHTAPAVPRPARREEPAPDGLLPECPFTPAGPISWSERWRRRSLDRLGRS